VKKITGWLIRMDKIMKKKFYSDRTRVIGITIVTILVLSSFALLSLTLIQKGQVAKGGLILVVLGVLVIFAVKILKDQYEHTKDGFPIEDEMSKKVRMKAMSWAFLAGIYWLLALGWYDNLGTDYYGVSPFRDPSQATGVGILGMAIFFGIFWLYFSRKGDTR